jgi:hypothetical protein
MTHKYDDPQFIGFFSDEQAWNKQNYLREAVSVCKNQARGPESRLCWGFIINNIWHCRILLVPYSASDSCFRTFCLLWSLSAPTLTSTKMQALHEPGKKTSIFSLLNPQNSSVSYSPVGDPGGDANQSHSHAHRAIDYGHAYPVSEYSLRKATWEPNDRASHALDEHHHHSQYASYHQPSRMTTSHSPNSYYNHQQHHYSDRPILRSDRVEERYFDNGPHWQHQYSDSCHYSTPLSYSESTNGKNASMQQGHS